MVKGCSVDTTREEKPSPCPAIAEMSPVVVVAVHAQEAAGHSSCLPCTVRYEALGNGLLAQTKDHQDHGCDAIEANHGCYDGLEWCWV